MANSLHNVVVAGAAAQVAVQSVTDFFFRGVWVLRKQVDGGHDHARRAETALKAVALLERLLNWVPFIFGRKTLNGRHLSAIDLDGEDVAGFDAFTVNENGAGAAVGRVTPDGCSDEA